MGPWPSRREVTAGGFTAQLADNRCVIVIDLHPMSAQDMQRPLYMQPRDAIDYGVIDGIVTSEKEIIDEVKSADQWDKEAGLVRA